MRGGGRGIRPRRQRHHGSRGGGLPLPDARARSRRHARVARDDGRHRHARGGRRHRPRLDLLEPRRGRGRRGRAGRRTCSAAAPSTSPTAGRRCAAPSATSAAAAWPCRRSAPSTWRGGTSRRGCSACRSATCSAGAASDVPVYGSGGFTTLDRRRARRAGRGLDRGRLHGDEDQDRRELGRRPRARPRARPAAAPRSRPRARS